MSTPVPKTKPQEYRAPSDYQMRILAFIDAQDDAGVTTDDVVAYHKATRWKAQRDLMRLVDRAFVDASDGRFYITRKAEMFLNAPRVA